MAVINDFFQQNSNIKCCLLTLVAVFAFITTDAQTRTVTGTVTDEETGEALVGATIVEEGTSNGSISDINGSWSIEVDGNSPTLIFSYIGYETSSIDVGSQSIIDVSLSPSTSQLEEVTVIGYGTAKKRDLTGAVGSVKGSSFEVAQPLSVQNALAGRVAGVQVTQTDNGPGAGFNILIRGGSSLTAGNQPLYVIDGFPFIPEGGTDNFSTSAPNPLADIATNQIESIEILKDASATAIYGAQGANGVIIITTKQGRLGKPKVTAEVSYGVSRMDNAPDMLSPEEYAQYRANSYRVYNYRNPVGWESQINFWENIDESGLDGNVWIEEITEQAPTTNVNVAFNGGSENFKYAISGNYLDQQGIILNSAFERINLNANLEQSFNDRLRLGTSLKFSTTLNTGLFNSWQESAIIKRAIQSNPYVDPEFSWLEPFDASAENHSWNNENIVNYVNTVDNQFETTRTIGNVFLSYQLLDGLKFYTSYGFNYFIRNEHQFLPIDTQQGLQTNGRADFRDMERNRFVYQARLNYNKNLGQHNINLTGAFETTKNEALDYRQRITGFEDDSRGIYDLSSATIIGQPSNIYEDNTLLSYLGRVNYNFAGKYLFTASLRADGSSVFGKNNKWGYFPSVALGWVASDEGFINNLNLFDLLKVRASYGVTGNNQIPNYQSLARLQTAGYALNDRFVTGIVPANVSNPDLKWETTSQYNLGLDLGFLNNRLQITADAYYKETNDLLLEVNLPPTSGFQTAIQNVGSISNKGVELSITTVNFDRREFNWTSTLTFSANRSEVLDLGEADELLFDRIWYWDIRQDVLVREGQQIGIYYGYIEDEVTNSLTEATNTPDNTVLGNEVGMTALYDVNGDGVINISDRVPLAKTVPDFIGGLNNQISYRNFDLSFFLRWSVGNDVINGNVLFIERIGQGNWNTLPGFSRFAYSPANPSGTIHGQVGDTYSDIMRSGYVEDGSFLKIDYITLGYTYPRSKLDRIGVQSLRVFSRVTNPFLFTRYSWFDPEVSTGWGTAAQVGPGADVGTYPRAITYTIGLTVGL